MKKDEIYNNIRETFHSQSGLFLNKEQSMAIATIMNYFVQNNRSEVLEKLASDVIMWQDMFNKAQDELSKLDGKSRMKVLIEDKQELINKALGLYKEE